MDKKKVGGWTLVAAGCAMLLFNALNYLLAWDAYSPAFTVFWGVIFVLNGLQMVRKES
ncbi:MAG: hypothetical protein QHH05_02185 [Syntrophomonadaceae bacterium]|nr:hypothetical protein [Syntrophomonadaceae bacterium]